MENWGRLARRVHPAVENTSLSGILTYWVRELGDRLRANLVALPAIEPAKRSAKPKATLEEAHRAQDTELARQRHAAVLQPVPVACLMSGVEDPARAPIDAKAFPFDHRRAGARSEEVAREDDSGERTSRSAQGIRIVGRSAPTNSNPPDHSEDDKPLHDA